MATINQNGEIHSWLAESLRLTAFLSPSVVLDNPNWWALTIGSEPDSRTARPSRGEFLETGSYLENALTLTVQPGRVDWILGISQAQLEDPEVALKSIGRFSAVVEDFSTAMTVWLKSSPPIIRIAFGAVLLNPVSSKEEGYSRLCRYLPSVKIDNDSQDFFYQINRPRPLPGGSESLMINRLSRWSVLFSQPLRMAFSLGSAQSPSPPVIFSPPDSVSYACRLELDLSTPAPRQAELSHEELPTLFREIAGLGLEIANQGDLP